MSESATVRSVRVRFAAEIAGYVRDVRTAGHETDKAFAGINTRLSITDGRLGDVSSSFDRVATSERKVSTESRRVSTEVDRMGSRVDQARVKVDTGARSLDRYSGRLGIVTDLALGLGPALVTIGAEGAPAIAALGTNFLFAGAGAGTALLAFHGVGDALKKFNQAELEPTEANLKSAHEAFMKLPPDTRNFVVELQRLRPELGSLQRAAANGIIPGASQGLRSLTTDLPIVRRGVHNIAGEMGILARDTGDALASKQWKPFLRFVGQEAPIGLAVMGRSLGHVGHGVAELVMDFTPLTHDVDRGIIRLAQDFDRWATSVGRTKGFQDFLIYLEQNGPRVVDLLGETATTFLDISRAAAPLGGPVIDILSKLLGIVDSIANSDFGTPIFAGILAFRAYARVAQVLGVQVETSFKGMITAPQAVETRLKSLTVTTASWARSTVSDLGVVSRSWRTTASSIEEGAARSQAAGRLGKAGSLIGKGAVAGGGLALVATGVADKMHLANTATLALAGSIAGPWGAAVGAGVGLLLDFTQHQDHSAASTADFTQTLNQQTGAITENTRVMAAKALQDDGAFEDAKKLGIGIDTVTKASLGNKDALAQVNAQIDYYLKQQPQYTAGGARVFNQDEAKSAGELSTELGRVGTNLRDDQSKTRELSAALGHNVSSTHQAADAHHLLAARLKAERQAAGQVAAQFITLGDDVDNAKVSLDRWIHQLEHQAQALTEFGNNARTAADKGLRKGLIDALEKAGPAGALRMRQLANATQTEIAKANRAWASGKKATEDYQDAAAYVSQHPANIYVNGVPQSIKAIRAVQSALAAIRDKTVTLTTKRVTGGHIQEQAAGGTVAGPRHPYGDKVLTMLAPGEEIITNRHGEADRFRSDRASGRIPAYADGGTVNTHVTTTPAGLYMRSPELAREITGVRGHLHQLSTALAAATKTLDQERQARQTLVQNEKALAASVRDQFRTDLFADQGSVWDANGGFNPLGTLQADIGDARQFRGLLRSLHRRGVGGQLLAQLAQSGSITDAQQLAAMSGGRLRDVEHAFRVRQRLTADVGQFAGVAVFGDRIAEQTEVVRRQAADVAALRREQHEANRRLGQIEKAVHKNAKDTAKELNTKGSQAARRVAH